MPEIEVPDPEEVPNPRIKLPNPRIKVHNRVKLPRDHSRIPSLAHGESGILVTTGLALYPELASLILPPKVVVIAPLTYTTSNDQRTYRVTVRGWSLDQFLNLVDAYADGDLTGAEAVLENLRPPKGDPR